jgi:asparaginyl-tRNA synthetase
MGSDLNQSGKYSAAQLFGGPYSAEMCENGPREHSKRLKFLGSKAFKPCDLRHYEFSESILKNRLHQMVSAPRYKALHSIDNAIFNSVVRYFQTIGAEWCNLPLTTLMISSPGEVYAGKTLDYTTDALPVQVSWFDFERKIFLSESSQFYLELRLLLEDVGKVFSIYNSFRKEKADATHLSEFQHIEFEGKVSLFEDIAIAENLLRSIVLDTVENESSALKQYLTDDEIAYLPESVASDQFETLTLKQALDILYRDTSDERYKKFSLKHFGSWEEVRLTRLVGRHCWITQFPMLEIPFYHAVSKNDEEGIPLAENADLILYGYREVIGAGTRIREPKVLAEKARIFKLPIEDYEAYFEMRNFDNYETSSGFGLGWQRLLHWMLKLPVIWEASHVPRGHLIPKP